MLSVYNSSENRSSLIENDAGIQYRMPSKVEENRKGKEIIIPGTGYDVPSI